MNKFVGTSFGIAKVTGCICEDRYVNLKLTENSWFPNQELKMYPVQLIQELEDHD
uniref:Uncharacterized protein n=1 Tax=viral metagenome TaxID=1070528 RepID=A0A6M3IDG0_9ZZZZ